jgi:hypothetical protein
MSTKRFNEGTNVVARVNFLDDRGAGSAPSTVHYTLRNVTHNRVVIDWTEVSPAATIEIDIPASFITLVNQGASHEVQELTVVANKDLPTQIPNLTTWRVVNLRAIR